MRSATSRARALCATHPCGTSGGLSSTSALASSSHLCCATSLVASMRTFSTRSHLLSTANTITTPHTSLAMAAQHLPGQGPQGTMPVTYTSGSGTGDALQAPATAITGYCDVLSECLNKADELKMQMKAQEHGDASAQILTKEAMDEYIDELKANAETEIATIVENTRTSPALWQQAGMHELRRTLYYATQLKDRQWLQEAQYTQIMRGLTVEFLRRDNEGVMAPDDVLYISTHVVISNFYNRHLWNRMEHSMTKWSNYENIDLASIKALSTKLFKTRRGCAKETLDVRRKILNAMARRVGTLANDFDLPSLLGVLQCYTVHDLMPRYLEPLAHRATNHISDYTPHECATLSQILRKWRLMRLEVCEKVVERICQSEELSHHMAISALLCVKSCFVRISDGGRNAMNAEPMRQKLRAMGEQICCRLDEVTFPALPVILQILDTIVTMKIYVPKKCLQSIFRQANDMISVVTEGKDDLVDPKTGKRVRAITAEEGRQLQALLYHYGSDLSAELSTRLKEAFREGLLPDEASVF